MDVPNDETLRQRRERDRRRTATQEFVKCRFCGWPWHGLKKHFPDGRTCHGSHEGSEGITN